MYNLLNKSLTLQNSDLKAEVQLATLIEDGVSPDTFIINLNSIFRRNFSGDIEKVKKVEQKNGVEKLAVFLNRSGIYDLVPEGVFHQPQSRKANLPTHEIVAEIIYQRKKEEELRKFFLPFEQEFFLHRLLVEFEERKFFVSLGNTSFNHIFREFWNLDDSFTHQEATNLMYLLPLAHEIAGDIPLSVICFESILAEPVEITFGDPLCYDINSIATDVSSELRIGDSFMLGGVYKEMIPSAHINIGPISNSALSEYLTGGKKEKLLLFLIKNFIPFEWDVIINFDIDKKQRTFNVNETQDASRLGFNAFI